MCRVPDGEILSRMEKEDRIGEGIIRIRIFYPEEVVGR